MINLHEAAERLVKLTGAKMKHVFISYAREDAEYVQKLIHELRRRDISVWSDRDIFVGEKWSIKIFAAIRQSAFVIVIMSPASEASDWVMKELKLAEKYKAQILPLLLSGENFDFLVDRQYQDVADGKLPPDNFFERLKNSMDRVNTHSVDEDDEITKCQKRVAELEKLVKEYARYEEEEE